MRYSESRNPALRAIAKTLALSLLIPITALAQPDASISYVGQFGQSGNAVGQFRIPTDLDMDSAGRLLIMDWGNSRIQRCSVDGQCEIYGPPLASRPQRLVVDSMDQVILTDSSNHRMMLCDVNQSCNPLFGSMGTGPGQFNDPKSVDIDSQGRLVIADRYNDRVQFCDYEGNCTAFGTFNSGPDAVPGEFWEPNGIAADGKGAIYVGETGDEVVSICNESGECSARLGSEGDGIGQFKTPNSLALTSRGDLVINELSNHRFSVCTLEGKCIVHGSRGQGNGQFRSPTGVLVTSGDMVYVADTDNHRIQIFQITYNSPPPEPEFMINPGLNDAWYNVATNGQGFLITVFPEIKQMFVAWFTYDTQRPPEDVTAQLGEPGHRWLTAQGSYEGDTANLTIYVTEGGVFDSAVPPVTSDPNGDGTMMIRFADCTEALVEYEITSIGRSGEIPIERIAPDNEALCEALNDA